MIGEIWIPRSLCRRYSHRSRVLTMANASLSIIGHYFKEPPLKAPDRKIKGSCCCSPSGNDKAPGSHCVITYPQWFQWFKGWWDEVIISNTPVKITFNDGCTDDFIIEEQPYIVSTWSSINAGSLPKRIYLTHYMMHCSRYCERIFCESWAC